VETPLQGNPPGSFHVGPDRLPRPFFMPPFLLLSLLILLGRWSRGQSLEKWKFVAAASLLVMPPIFQVSTVLYDPAGAVDLLGLNQETQEYCRAAEAEGTADDEFVCYPAWKKPLGAVISFIDALLP
jgi:hypothetical protein